MKKYFRLSFLVIFGFVSTAAVAHPGDLANEDIFTCVYEATGAVGIREVGIISTRPIENYHVGFHQVSQLSFRVKYLPLDDLHLQYQAVVQSYQLQDGQRRLTLMFSNLKYPRLTLYKSLVEGEDAGVLEATETIDGREVKHKLLCVRGFV